MIRDIERISAPIVSLKSFRYRPLAPSPWRRAGRGRFGASLAPPSRRTESRVRNSATVPRVQTQRRRLLVVDDDRAILTLIGTIARAEGFDVATTVNGEDAMKQLRQRRADLV